MLDGHDSSSRDEEKILHRRKRSDEEYVINQENVKAIMAAVHLDQVLYDKVIRNSPYTNTPLVVGYLEDFFVHTMSKRLEMMFVPVDNTKLPEQIGKVVITTMMKQTPLDRCKTLVTTYPCEFLTEEDKNMCRTLNHPPCFSKNNPPPGFGYAQWELMDSFKEMLALSRSYAPGGNEPYLILKKREPHQNIRKKRSPLRKLSRGRRPGKKRGSSSSSSKSGGSRGRSGSPTRNVNHPVLRTLGAGSGVGAGLGAAKMRSGAASPGVFTALSLQDINRMSPPTRSRIGSVSGTHSFTSGSGLHAANPPPVSLTNLRARPTSIDSFRMNSPVVRTPSSGSLSSPGSTGRGAVVPQPVPAPRSGWHPMPPLDPPNYFIPKYKDRPVPVQRRNLAGDRPLSRSSSTSSLNSLDTSIDSSRPATRLTNEGGSFLPQVREDFKLHNRVGDSMRKYAERHPFLTKVGGYAGTGLAGLGAYIGVSQIDRAIQKEQDRAEDKTAEKHKNVTDTLEADLLRERLANERFKQQSEFASKVLVDAIKTGNVPTALLEQATQAPVAPVSNYGSWTEVNRGKNSSLN